ncbi:MAG TPA: hypothetical protein VKY74_25290, partial [Chloroflexia bacterium]|nr:hypothetical protein [Chloroflexia bacterium]
MRNKVIIAVIVIVILGVALVGLRGVLGGGQAAASVQTLAVQRGDLSATVLSSGALQPAADLNLTFSAAGTVAQLFVH